MQAYGSTPIGGQQLEGWGAGAGLAARTQAERGSLPGLALGIHAKSASTEGTLQFAERPVSGDGKLQRLWRFALQASARELLPRERVGRCLRRAHGETVDVLFAPEHRVGLYRGLQTCGSVWQCAVCAAKISERRRGELSRAVGAWTTPGHLGYRKEGGHWIEDRREPGRVLLVTFTVQHERGDSVEWVVDGLLEARRRLRSGRMGEELRERAGLRGSVRALEVTHGQNGWHPHVHELWFVRPDVSLNGLQGYLGDVWGRSVQAAGLRGVNEHGADLRFADLDVAGYVSKFGYTRTWGPEHELAKVVSKRGRGSNRTPVDLLTAYHCGRDEGAGGHWSVYARAFKGKRQLVWSSGLRSMLGLGAEQTDEEVAAAVETYSVLLASLTRQQWLVILEQDARADVLEVARCGDSEALWQFLLSLGVERDVT